MWRLVLIFCVCALLYVLVGDSFLSLGRKKEKSLLSITSHILCELIVLRFN